MLLWLSSIVFLKSSLAFAQTESCAGLNQRCSSSDRSPFVQQFRTTAEVCRIEKAALGCDYIAGNDQEVAANIQKCDAFRTLPTPASRPI
ncbi:MAG: hypothetical protein LW875_03255 [Proteobacteria bacterium]|jgi:hypothetical protein|nr:hypothetical protein [Pseudomonadota bacterium]